MAMLTAQTFVAYYCDFAIMFDGQQQQRVCLATVFSKTIHTLSTLWCRNVSFSQVQLIVDFYCHSQSASHV